MNFIFFLNTKRLLPRSLHYCFKRHIKFSIMTENKKSSPNELIDISSMGFKIYTKTGDKGETSLLGGARVKKDNEIFELLGDIDELNSYLGLVKKIKN